MSACLYADLGPGTQIVYEGVSYFHTVVTPDRRFMAMSSTGAILTMPDPETGLPAFPDVAMMRIAQRERRLVIRSDALDNPVRRDARAEEATPAEIEARDSWAPLRRKFSKAWDNEPEDAKPMRSDAGLVKWLREIFDEEEIKARYGRLPCGTTIRTWIRDRGRKGDRRMVDMESRSGKVRRRRRYHELVIAIGKAHALALATRQGRRQKSAFNLFKRDVARAAKGLPVTIDGIEIKYDAQPQKLPAYGRETFRLECKRAINVDTTSAAWGQKAAQQLFGGGGKAKEPTRFMELVEQDDTPFPKYFVIDLQNRVPCGTPTAVFSMDVCTRAFIGWDISFDSPSLSTWMRAVAHGAEPKEVPKRFAKSHPELADIGGYVVGAYLYDNALQNVAKAVEDAGGDLCHEVRLAGEGQPTHKGHVERGHQTVQSLMAEVPGGSYSIPLMRRFGYDPEKHVIVTISEFRAILAEAIATYHLTPSTALGNRCPLDVWIEQMNLHGLSQARDHDQFLRSIGDVDYVDFSRTGCSLHELDYSGGEGQLGNASLLSDLAAHSGPSKSQGDPTFRVKVKSYPDDIGFVSVWNPLSRRYVDVPCTKQRYAKGKPLWLHERTIQQAAALGRDFFGKTEAEVEDALIEIEAGLCDMIAEVLPEAAARQRQLMARLVDRKNIRRYLGDSINFVRVQPSPSGMESRVDHELRATVRRDDMVEAQRRRRGTPEQRDTRNAGGPRAIGEKDDAKTPRRSSRNRTTERQTTAAPQPMANAPEGRGRVSPLTVTPFK